MKRFLISSRKFTGNIDLLYDSDGRLLKIDFSDTDMHPGGIEEAKRRIPALVDSLADGFAGTIATIVEADVEVEFKSFWNAYGKKINPQRCKPLWAKLNTAEQVKAINGIKAYDKYLRGLSYDRPKADPEKYLKDRYWENEWK